MCSWPDPSVPGVREAARIYQDMQGLPMPLCHCLATKAREEAELRAFARLPNSESPKTLEGFRARPGSQEASAAARAFVASPRQRVTVLAGTTGCGKSHLLEGVARALLAQGVRVLYLFAPDLVDELREQLWEDSRTAHDIAQATVLIIDDLGSQAQTPFAIRTIYAIVDARYRGKVRGQRLLIGTNQVWEDMAEDGPNQRLASRVFADLDPAVQVIYMEATNARREA